MKHRRKFFGGRRTWDACALQAAINDAHAERHRDIAAAWRAYVPRDFESREKANEGSNSALTFRLATDTARKKFRLKVDQLWTDYEAAYHKNRAEILARQESRAVEDQRAAEEDNQ